jgi:hypothetical protein
MQQIAQTAFEFKTNAPSPLEVFKARADAIATLLANHFLADQQSAVDGLWRYAKGSGLIADIGVDAVQSLLAEAFREC